MQPKSIPFTKAGYEAVKIEQKQLQERRPLAVSELSKARAMGDLSENGYYKAAKSELVAIDRRLREVAYLLQYGKITEALQNDFVSIGCTVTIETEAKKQTYNIVGGYESDPLLGKLSHISPIGKALIGKKVGESVTVNIPQGSATYKIIAISLPMQ